jgi:integrase
MKHIEKIKKEIKSVNRGSYIKIRLRKLNEGFSLYLDLFKRGIRERQWTKIKLSGKEVDWIEDKEKIKYVQHLRNEKEKQLYQKQNNFSLDNLSSNITILDYHKKITATKKPETIGKWKVSYKRLKEFLIKYYSENIYIKEVENNRTISKEYADFLEKCNEIKKITANGYFKIYNGLLNQAVKDGLILINPAKHINITYEETKKEFLSVEELKRLEKTECPRKQIRNAFLFACYTGFRLSDIKNMKFSDIENINNISKEKFSSVGVTEKQLTIKMQKTKKYVSVPIISKAMDILEEQKEIQNGDQIFTLYHNSWLGDKLKIWFARAGIEKRITFHSARHTFVTLLISSGVDIYTVSKLCGHSSVQVTEKAYANLIDSKRFGEMGKFSYLFSSE